MKELLTLGVLVLYALYVTRATQNSTDKGFGFAVGSVAVLAAMVIKGIWSGL